MKRHRYRYKSRLEAESAYEKSQTECRNLRWFATALLQDRVHWSGFSDDHRVGYFSTRYSAFVVVLNGGIQSDRISIISDVYDIHSNEFSALTANCTWIPELLDLIQSSATSAWNDVVSPKEMVTT